MKTKRSARYLLAVIALLATISLTGICIAEDQASDDPAQDPIYLKLKDKDVNSMTPREYEMFKQKEAAVSQYRLSEKSREQSRKLTEAAEKSMKATSTMTYVYVGLTVLSIVLLLSVA